MTLLRQASLDVGLVDPAHAAVPSTKLDLLMEMLDDIVSDGHRVLVFSQFTRFLGLARERMAAAGIEHCYLDGRTRNRPQVIAQFREGDAPVFLISLKAGGFGLNLTEADTASSLIRGGTRPPRPKRSIGSTALARPKRSWSTD